ncbi:MAG: adenylate kinase family protein [Candidatus Bilamarchaeaceae archaeon]
MKIVVTGVPGTGKSEISRRLAGMLGLEYISLSELIDRQAAAEIEDGEKVVDIKKLQKIVEDYFIGKDNYVVESHLACEVVIPADYVIVLRTHPDVLRKRLEARKYSKSKVDENIEAELLDYCVQRVMDVYLWRPIEVDTTKTTPLKAAQKIALAIKYKKRVIDEVNYSPELKKKLGLK